MQLFFSGNSGKAELIRLPSGFPLFENQDLLSLV